MAAPWDLRVKALMRLIYPDAKMKFFLFLLLVTTLALTACTSVAAPEIPPAPQTCEHWVAPPPEGVDTGPGTFAQPWATLEHAATTVPDNHCIVWFKDGIYTGESRLTRRFLNPVTFRAINAYMAIFEHDDSVISLSGVKNMVFEGFEFRHAGPASEAIVVSVHSDKGQWAEMITFRNNIFHDSYNDDLLKMYNGVRFATIEGNLFYNQGDSEQHMDVNSVTDSVIQDNIFFNDYAGSGRPVPEDTKAFIVIKDSGEEADGQLGSERVTVRRNIFLNWQGTTSQFLKIGNDGKPFHEGRDIVVENNLFVGNSPELIGAAFGVSGGRDILFRHNTIVGNLPAREYAFFVDMKDKNPINENVYFYNNIWSDFTGTMGSEVKGLPGRFSDGDPEESTSLILDNNLYWNGGASIPGGDLVSPLIDDINRLVADPLLNVAPENIVLPRWDGSWFISCKRLIRQEFVRLVMLYGALAGNSPAIGAAASSQAPSEDILGQPRTAQPDMGAYEYQVVPSGLIPQPFRLFSSFDTNAAASLTLSPTSGTDSQGYMPVLFKDC